MEATEIIPDIVPEIIQEEKNVLLPLVFAVILTVICWQVYQDQNR